MHALDTLKREILDFCQAENWRAVQQRLKGQYAGDLADVIEFLPPNYHQRAFSLIEEDTQPDVLAELEGRASTDVLNALSNAELAELFEEMSPDDAADVIADLSDERSEQVLELMEDEESEDVRELLKYDEESAGGIMTTDIFALRDTYTIAQALETITQMEEDEPFYYAYVVDEHNVLIGWIGLWQMLRIADHSKKLGAIANRDIIAVHTDEDQEQVGKVMARYDLTALPVINPKGQLVGRVTVDDVMDVMEEEASEDIFRLAGSDDVELTYTSPFKVARVRLPWLLITLATGFLTSTILSGFMSDLREVIALSFFVPIVMAMGGNTGIQSSTLVIRSLALGSLEGRTLFRLLGREIMAGAVMGLFCSVIIGVWANFFITHSQGAPSPYPAFFLASTVGLALLCAMTFAAAFGAFVPILLNKFNVDPAVASGPFVTSSNDIFALLIYYGVAVSLVTVYYYSSGAAV